MKKETKVETIKTEAAKQEAPKKVEPNKVEPEYVDKITFSKKEVLLYLGANELLKIQAAESKIKEAKEKAANKS